MNSRHLFRAHSGPVVIATRSARLLNAAIAVAATLFVCALFGWGLQRDVDAEEASARLQQAMRQADADLTPAQRAAFGEGVRAAMQAMHGVPPAALAQAACVLTGGRP